MAENETKKISVELSAEIAKFTAAMAAASKAVLSAAGIVAKETDSMAASVEKVGGATKKETNAIVAGLQQQAKVAKATAVIFSAAEKQRKDSATANIAVAKQEAAATVAAIKQQQLALAKIRTEKAGQPKTDGGIGGIAATLGTGAVAGAAGASLFNFAQTASDLEKTDFLLSRVFKGRKQEVVDFGDTISQSIGLSTLEAQGSLAKFGSQLSNALGGLGPATEYSKRLLAVAADISAAQNVDFVDTVQRLQSGIRGETEAIENLNIFVGANQLNPLALTEFGTSFAKLNEAQKTVVRLKGIFQQTTAIVGTAAAQVNTFQSSFNRLEGSLQNLKIALGQELISGFATLFQIVTGSVKAFIAYSNAGSGLLAKLAVLTIGIVGLSAAFISAIAAIQFFTPAIAGVGLALFGVNSAIQAVLLTVGYLILGIGALVAGFSFGALILNIVGLGDSVDKVFESVTKLGDAFNNLFSGQSGKARDFADAQGKIADRALLANMFNLNTIALKNLLLLR